MIDRQHGKLIIECDGCSEIHEGDSFDFNEVWTVAKQEGWRAKKIGDVWTHRCPTCAENSVQ